MSSGVLYVVGTPIGNLSDLPERAVETLRTVDRVYAEDTRRTGRLLSRVGAEADLRSLHEHNEARRTEELLEALERGLELALVSDAGTPAVSDPGRRAVEGALEAGHRVVPVPGASAVTAALSASGLAADRFLFLGFPPRSGAEREAWLDRCEGSTETVVVFESPNRVDRLLEDWRERGMGSRTCVLCRELTKMHEEVRRAPVGELADMATAAELRGEVTLVLEGARQREDAWRDRIEEIRRVAGELAGRGTSTRDVARRLQEEYGVPRNAAYEIGLEAGRDREAGEPGAADPGRSPEEEK